jgi:hypothetical protein
MILPAPIFAPVIGEDSGARIVRIVRSYVGCSLSNRCSDLAALVGRGVDDSSIVAWKTNCAVFVLGVLYAAGCPWPVLQRPLTVGTAFSVLVSLGQFYNAWKNPVTEGPPIPGAAMWYETPGDNDDHAEFHLGGALGDEHGGGGRADNLISIGDSPEATSLSMPMHRWLDIQMIGLPDATAPEVS